MGMISNNTLWQREGSGRLECEAGSGERKKKKKEEHDWIGKERRWGLREGWRRGWKKEGQERRVVTIS